MMNNDEMGIPIVEPELIYAPDETGQQIICPSCGKSPYFIEEDNGYHVSCGCQTASIEKKGLENEPRITRQDVKDFLFEKWVEQVHGLCPEWRYEEFKGWN